MADHVVMVPGYMDNTDRQRWERLEERLLEDDYSEDEVHQVSFSPERGYDAVPGAAGLTTDHPAFYARELQEYVEETLDQEERISLLAHSMGGLVSRHYVEELEGGDYVDSLVTLGTPHQGSLLAYMGGHTRGGRAMQPGSEFLENLNDDIAEDVDYTVVWSEDDRMIQPSTYGRMPVDADNVDEIHVDVGDPFDLFAPPGTNHLRLMEPDVYKTYRHRL